MPVRRKHTGKLKFYLGMRDRVWSLRLVTSSFWWVVLTFKVANGHLCIQEEFSTTHL